ncbi:hypothetical protein BDV25DRAFT_138772 [Aspergillus avenaceus]|uniref:RTA1 like protein-domain-containing protein n=1 Tax=Aspergillus avenaceus TaxID=36643 RepID=A0A5N6TYW4_ASPAV|nr:hypothetical protein BDV25DRAFT_138772 [Aspergillus avenaceus]
MHLWLPLLIGTAVAASSNSTPTVPPHHGTVLRRDTVSERDYDPHITIDIPTISIPKITIPPVTIPTLSLDLPSNTCTPTIAPDKNGWVPASECNALYLYYPSLEAAVAFSVLFGFLMVSHFIQATVHKTAFVWVILMGATWECIGFVIRAVSTRDQQSTTLATMTQLFILLSPFWVNAFDYMVLARMIHYFLPERRVGIFKPSLLATIFVFLDLGSFIIQLVGGSMAGAGQPQDQMTKGIHIYMAGIGIQEFFIVLFFIIAIQFHRKMLHYDRTGIFTGLKTKWRRLLYALYVSLVFITVRIIYRLVEFSSGNNASNSIPYHEWYMFAFDAFPMLLAIGVWNVVHPGTVLQGPDAKMPASGIRRICCFGCDRQRQKGMERIPDESRSRDEIMLAIRGRAAS